VTLVTPPHGAVITADSVTVVWNPTEPAVDYYHVELAYDSLFVNSIVIVETFSSTAVEFNLLQNNETYWWRVAAHNAFGFGPWSDPWNFSVLITGIGLDPTLPREHFLYQNYPNPFNPSTTIRYGLPQQTHVTLEVFNMLGQQVALLMDEPQDAGYHEVIFERAALASGLYFYRLRAGDFVGTKKLILMK